jgi:hypothetical protein
MKSPLVSHFVTSNADDPRSIQRLRESAQAEMRKKIEGVVGQKQIRFTFKPLNTPPPSLVMNIKWEVRAYF